MCFSPKINVPKQQVSAPEPAPLTDEVKGVEFGGSPASGDTSTEDTKSGRSSLKVDMPKAGGAKKVSMKSRAFGG